MANYTDNGFRRTAKMDPAAYRQDQSKSAQKTSEQVEEEINAFLASGGEVTQVERGVSGAKPTRHITFSKKRMAEQ